MLMHHNKNSQKLIDTNSAVKGMNTVVRTEAGEAMAEAQLITGRIFKFGIDISYLSVPLWGIG